MPGTDGYWSLPGNDSWLSYIMNREDIWISRIPLPVRYGIKGKVEDNFNNLQSGGAVADWNIYAPKWAPVDVTDFPSSLNKSLLLQDKDPYDYARAIRVFEETKKAKLAEAVNSVERISFRTGPYRDLPNRKTPNQDPAPPLSGADERVSIARFYIDDFSATSKYSGE